MMMRPCSSSSYSLTLFLLIVAPLAVSPYPLRDAAHDVAALKPIMQPVSVRAETQGGPVSGPSESTASLATPELSANQSPNVKNLPSLLRPQPRYISPSDDDCCLEVRGSGTPITTFDDGFVLEVSSGVATNLPTPTSAAINTTQNSPNPPPQDPQGQTQAVPNSTRQQTTGAAQLGSGNTNTITTLPGSSTAPAALPGTVSTQAAPTSNMYINGVIKSTAGRDPTAVPQTTALALAPFVSVFTTVDSDGKAYTTSVVFSSTSQLANASADASAEQVDHSRGSGPGNESPSGHNPPFFSQPAAAAGVIIAGVVAGLALCGVFILIRRHREQLRKQGELQSIHSNADYPDPSHQFQADGDPFSASRRHSFQSDRSSTYGWYAHAHAELEAMEELNRTVVTYSTPPANNRAPTTYPHVQAVTAGKGPARLSAIQETDQMSPFADHAAVAYAPTNEPGLTPLTPFSQPATSVPSTYIDVPRQQYSPLLPTNTGLVPLARAPPLRMRSRSTGTKSSTLPTSSTPSGSSPSPPQPPPRARTTSAPGSPQPAPPRWNVLPLLKRTPQPQTAPSSTGSTSGRKPFTDLRSLTPGENAQVLQERLSNPFADGDSTSEDDIAVADAHASYFPDFNFPELERELGLGLGSSRASVEDVLGYNEQLRAYAGRVDVRASVVTITEGGRRPADAGVVVPMVTIQAPSNEDGISLLSSEVDSTEMMQSLEEENLFYNGGPKGHASLTAVGAGRE